MEAIRTPGMNIYLQQQVHEDWSAVNPSSVTGSRWAQLKRVLKGGFHQVSMKHQYLAEVMWRHNHRSSPVRDRMSSVVRSMEGRRLRLRDLRAGGRSVRLMDLEREERHTIQGELFRLAA